MVPGQTRTREHRTNPNQTTSRPVGPTEFPFQAFLFRRILLITSFTTHETSRMRHEHDQEQVKNTQYKAVQRVAPQETRGWPSRVVDGTAARAPRSPNTLPCAPHEST